MIPHFKEHTYIRTDKQHFDIKQTSMIVQEKEPLSAKRLQGDRKMVVIVAFKTRGNRCRTWSYNDFSLYVVHRPDGLPLGSNRHQSVKFCYRNCYTNRSVAISVAVTAK